MESTLFYLLRVSIAAATLYMSYKLFLSKKTFHAINRMVLIFIVPTSLILPLFNIHVAQIDMAIPKVPTTYITTTNSEIPTTNRVVSGTTSTETAPIAPTSKPWSEYLFVLYLVGVALISIRLISSYIHINLIIRKAEKRKLNNFTLCISEQKIAAFSWNRYIVISSTDSADDNQDIIKHEQAHLAFNHSYDLLLYNLYSLVWWFNPFTWLLRRELQMTHEYQADAKVLSEGANLKNYQLLLIRKCVGEQKFALAHNFEYKNLQKRLQMIMKEKTGAMQKWLYTSLIIAILGSIAGISCTKSNSKNTETTDEPLISNIFNNQKSRGHFEGSFTKTTINGKLQIHTYKKTEDIIKDSKGKVKAIIMPGDSILAEILVVNGKFSYDYDFTQQHHIRLVFIDNKGVQWRLGFVNPYANSLIKFSSSYCIFDNNANINLKIDADKTEVFATPQSITSKNKNSKINYEVRRSIKAHLTGSPATAEMFKEQLKDHNNVVKKSTTQTEYATGIVFDAKTKARLSNVKIVNINTKAETTTDKSGSYKIKANPNNLLSFSATGYQASFYYAEVVGNHNKTLQKLVGTEINNDGKVFSVTGEVRDVNFKPIERAKVWAEGSATCFTDKNGKYSLNAKYKSIVFISKNGYKDTAMLFVINTTNNACSYLHQ